jgi:hypothetical protein
VEFGYDVLVIREFGRGSDEINPSMSEIRNLTSFRQAGNRNCHTDVGHELGRMILYD